MEPARGFQPRTRRLQVGDSKQLSYTGIPVHCLARTGVHFLNTDDIGLAIAHRPCGCPPGSQWFAYGAFAPTEALDPNHNINKTSLHFDIPSILKHSRHTRPRLASSGKHRIVHPSGQGEILQGAQINKRNHLLAQGSFTQRVRVDSKVQPLFRVNRLTLFCF